MLGQAVESLIDNFCHQKDGYQLLSELAIRKKAALIKGDLKEIEGVTKEERGIILSLSKLEEDRVKTQMHLAEEFGMQPNELSLSVLAEKINGPLGVKLTAVGDALLTMLTTLREENETNTTLIEQSLEYINYTVDLLTDVDDLPTYPNQGNGANTARLFDKKI